jgi:CRISPR type III-associated protein (TIGR04423 family)
MKKIQINEIPQDIKFEGYYWYSDATSPIFEISIIDLAWFSTMPFIIEANFYNKEKGISISVKNINGEYYIYQYDLKGIEPHQLSHQDYLMRSFKGN